MFNANADIGGVASTTNVNNNETNKQKVTVNQNQIVFSQISNETHNDATNVNIDDEIIDVDEEIDSNRNAWSTVNFKNKGNNSIKFSRFK